MKTIEYPECSGDPASCPENEGYGCGKSNPEYDVFDKANKMAHDELAFYREAVKKDIADQRAPQEPTVSMERLRKIISRIECFPARYFPEVGMRELRALCADLGVTVIGVPARDARRKPGPPAEPPRKRAIVRR